MSEPSPWALSSIAGALLIALVLCLAPQLDAEDNSAEWGVSQELIELQATEAGTAKREAAAQKVCDKAHGPNSAVRWLPDGSLACTTRRAVVKQVQL